MARKAVHLKRKRAPFGGFLLCLALLSSTGVAFSSWQIGGTVGPKPEQVIEVGDVFDVTKFVEIHGVSSTPICPEGFVNDDTLVYTFSVFIDVMIDLAALYEYYGSTDYTANFAVTLNYQTSIDYDYQTTMDWRMGTQSGKMDTNYSEGSKSPASCRCVFSYETDSTNGYQNVEFEYLFPTGVTDAAGFAAAGYDKATFDYSVDIDLSLEAKVNA